jgi:hypothetical protein
VSVFGAAIEDLHADEDLSVAASFRRSPYAWESVRVILSHPTEAFGTARASTLQADLIAGAVTDTPQPGDELRIDVATYQIAAGTVFTVEDTERDPLALTWRLTLADRN